MGPYVTLAERLGNFAAHIATGNPQGRQVTYCGRIADMNTNLLRNAGLAGVLSRWLTTPRNLVNAMQIAAQRGLSVVGAPRQARRPHRFDPLELETDAGVTAVEGARRARQAAAAAGGRHLLRSHRSPATSSS